MEMVEYTDDLIINQKYFFLGSSQTFVLKQIIPYPDFNDCFIIFCDYNEIPFSLMSQIGIIGFTILKKTDALKKILYRILSSVLDDYASNEMSQFL